jgi:3-oxoacid CoA-transferase subunit A
MRMKTCPDAVSAVTGLLRDGMTLMAGGFGLCGIPETLIECLSGRFLSPMNRL